MKFNRKISRSRRGSHSRNAPCHCGSGKPYYLCHFSRDQDTHIHSGTYCPKCGTEFLKDISKDWFVRTSNALLYWQNLYKTHNLYKFSAIPLKHMLKLERMEKQAALTRQDLFSVYEDFLTLEQANQHILSFQEYLPFAARTQTMKDAIEAHYSGRYTLSIPVIFPLIEGVAREITGMEPSRSFQLQLDSNALRNRGILMVADDADYFNTFVNGLYQGQAGPNTFNRNPILHGITANYASREHSLILLLSLFELGYFYYWLHVNDTDISDCF